MTSEGPAAAEGASWNLRRGDTFDPTYNVWVMSKDDLTQMFDSLTGAEHVVFDLETTGLNEHAEHGGPVNGGVGARAVMMTVTVQLWPDTLTEPTTYIIPLSHPDSPFRGSWRRVFRAVAQRLRGKRLVGHHVKFDARWTYALTGVDLAPSIYWDTMISAALLDENATGKLKPRAADMFGIEPWDDVDLKYPGAAEDVPFFDLGLYAARDTYWTYRVFEAHRELMWLTGHEGEDPMWSGDDEDLQNARLGSLAEAFGMPTVATLAKVEQRGIGLDVGFTREALAEAEEESRRLSEEIAGRYEDDAELAELSSSFSLAPTSKWFKRFTTVAVERGELKVVAMTASGAPQWNAPVLEKLERRGSELAGIILRQRDMDKRAQFLTSWLEKVTPAGRIHATYNVGRVVTGRLSSSEPNMQQVSGKLKPSFVPASGCVLAEIDYSQIELRVAAMLSGCVPMIEAFQNGQDLHRLLGQRLAHHESLEDVTPEERQKAKSANFGLLYGMGPTGFQAYASTAYGVEMDLDEAHEVHQTFFDMWVGLTAWHDRQRQFAQRYGYVESPVGRVRRLPNIWSPRDDLRAEAERQAVNAPVQGLGSDIMQCAAASIEGHLPGHSPVRGAALVGTVHDSIVLEVVEDGWEAVVDECLDRMTEGILPTLEALGMKFTVPLGAEAAVGRRWGDYSLGTVERS